MEGQTDRVVELVISNDGDGRVTADRTMTGGGDGGDSRIMMSPMNSMMDSGDGG
jgi:hypothetical protein